MDTHDVPAGGIGSPLITLAPGQVATVRFADQVQRVTVIRVSGTDRHVWWTSDGTDPDPETGNGWLIPAGLAGIDENRDIGYALPHPASEPSPGTTVKVTAAGGASTCVVCVRRGS
jgi:hypothetical protein